MSTTTDPATATAVDQLLGAIVAGRGGSVANLYDSDAVLDGTVPGWRFTRRGPEAIAAEYGGWFRDPGRFEELERLPVDGGEVVRYLLAWEERGVPFAAHHCHVVAVARATGRITSEHVFCGGRWDAALLAEMAEAGDAH